MSHFMKMANTTAIELRIVQTLYPLAQFLSLPCSFACRHGRGANCCQGHFLQIRARDVVCAQPRVWTLCCGCFRRPCCAGPACSLDEMKLLNKVSACVPKPKDPCARADRHIPFFTMSFKGRSMSNMSNKLASVAHSANTDS